MRNRPTPSAGVSRAARAAAPSWTLARIATACPSAVAPGPDQRAALFGLALRSGDGLACGGVIRCHGDGAEGAVDEHHRSRRDGVESVDGDDARDAELAGDDRGVAGRAAQCGGQRDDERRVQTRGVGGREVLGAQDRRHVGQRDAGLRQAAELGDDAVADVPQVGDAFGHQPAELGEHVDELRRLRRPRRATAGVPCLDALLRGAQPGAVLRQRGGGGEHLRRSAGRVRRAVPEPVGDGGGGGGEPRRLGGPVCLLDICRRCVVERRAAARAGSPGAYWTPATTGTPRSTVPAG